MDNNRYQKFVKSILDNGHALNDIVLAWRLFFTIKDLLEWREGGKFLERLESEMKMFHFLSQIAPTNQPLNPSNMALVLKSEFNLPTDKAAREIYANWLNWIIKNQP